MPGRRPRLLAGIYYGAHEGVCRPQETRRLRGDIAHIRLRSRSIWFSMVSKADLAKGKAMERLENTSDLTIRVEEATIELRPVLGRLMQLYLFEFSRFDDGDVNDEGLFEYEYFDSYWQDDDRFPFLFYVDTEIAGFVLVNSHSVNTEKRNTKSIAECFVLPKHRKKSVGKRVAFHVFDMFPGAWQVCEMESNTPAQQFWRKVIAEYTNGNFDEVILDDENWRGPVQTFDNTQSA